jgi:hypothetical protein
VGTLIHQALQLTEAAFVAGYEYLKAKVIATKLVPVNEVQGNLLAPVVDTEKRDRLASDRWIEPQTETGCGQVWCTGIESHLDNAIELFLPTIHDTLGELPTASNGVTHTGNV